LVEGNSIRATVRITGVAKNTVAKLLIDLGRACADYQFNTVRNLQKTTTVQVDEIWAFVGGKEKAKRQGADVHGDAWTYVAIDADSKLIINWLVGPRTAESAFDFMFDLADRLPNRVQLSSDGHNMYKDAVKAAFDGGVDYGMIIKVFGNSQWEPNGRYSPAVCTSCHSREISGNPEKSKISTSYVERQNLTMRMGMRRFTRLSNGFSKKIENHEHAVSLHFMYVNFCRKHETIKTTPAIAAGVTDHVWTIDEVVALLSN
jgi:IS1 family transposase